MAHMRLANWEFQKDYRSPLALDVEGHSDTAS